MKLGHLLIASALLASVAATGALAQGTDEDIVVLGRYHHGSADTQSLSQRVSYADLDLGTQDGRDRLKHRLRLTARYLCDNLGESDSSDGVTPTCRDAAYQDAMQRLGTVEAHWAPRGTAWAPAAAWSAPYTDQWAAAHDDGYSKP